MSPAEAANLIDDAYRANSQVVSVEAAKVVRDDWDLQCGRVVALLAEHAAVKARLMAECGEAKAELTSLRRQLVALRDRVDNLIKDGA